MKKIYILLFAFILAGCSDENGMVLDPSTETGYTSIADIVRNVELGGYDHVGTTVRINGKVERAADNFNPLSIPDKYQITIETGSSEVEFFIVGDKVVFPLIEPNKSMLEYKQNFSYDFYIFISRVRPHRYILNGYKIISHLIVDKKAITIDTLVSDVRLKNQEYRYTDNIIKVEDGVEVITEPGIIRLGIPNFELPDKIFLKIDHNDVHIIVNDYKGEPNNLHTLKDDMNQRLTLFITDLYEDTNHCPTICSWINTIIVWD